MAQMNAFQTAVTSISMVKDCLQPGLRAMGEHSRKVESADPSLLQGSLDLDACVTQRYPQANRWDYVVGHDSLAYFIEVHSANTGEVSVVLAKLQWLKDWLNAEAQPLKRLIPKDRTAFFWVQSKNFNIPKESAQYRAAQRAGLVPVRGVRL